MNYENEMYIDESSYEDMDDLALPDRIEWNNEQNQGFILEALDYIDL